MSVAIKVENLSKAYQLGTFSTGTLSRDLERWWTKMRGKEDPFLKIGETNDRSAKGASDIVWSLKDLDFSINQGEALGVIGKNGAGKSTLLKILSRVTTPTIGSVKVKGRVASLLEVGTGFHPELTGRENVFLNGAILGMRKKEIIQKFDEIVDFAGVERYIDTPVKRYSSGMYVRLAFAVAAHLDSEILIVDEVLAVGDAEFQKKCLGKMEDISAGAGRTVIFVSHNMQSIKQFCRKSILLKHGKMIDHGPTEEVLDNYLYVDRERSFDNQLMHHVGNREVSIKRVRLVDGNKQPIDNYFINVPHFVEISYTINEASRLQLSFILSAGDGTTLFGSLNNHETNFYTAELAPGEYKSYIEIPGNLLNAGSYNIGFASFMVGSENFYTDTILSFDTEDDGSLKKDFSGQFGGYLRPKLNWETIKIDL